MQDPPEDRGQSGARPVRVRRLSLADFRSYPSLDLAVSASQIALVGDNGAGKTNLLEALSLFSPGRGMRRAEFAECARDEGPGGWAISIEIESQGGLTQLGTGISGGGVEGASMSRRNRIDRNPVASSGAFADRLRLVWLTPEMDLLFVGAPGERRRFLDRLVLAIDANHASRVAALDRATRSRNRLLEDGGADQTWLDAVEREIAELGVAVAVARADAVSRLGGAIARHRTEASAFPWAEIALAGELEEQASKAPALELEERHRRFLRANRSRDAAARRTGAGLRPADLLVRHGPKQIDAGRCSTGEQKALLVGLILAHARLVADASGLAPIVLLDELSAHFDPARRAALYADLSELGSQVWMTGADPAAFAELAGDAQVFRVTPGRVAPFSKNGS
jgi:DNA replication and repair protein RecF